MWGSLWPRLVVVGGHEYWRSYYEDNYSKYSHALLHHCTEYFFFFFGGALLNCMRWTGHDWRNGKHILDTEGIAIVSLTRCTRERACKQFPILVDPNHYGPTRSWPTWPGEPRYKWTLYEKQGFWRRMWMTAIIINGIWYYVLSYRYFCWSWGLEGYSKDQVQIPEYCDRRFVYSTN